MNTHIFLQARENSTRLPKKILKKISGKSILAFVVERMKNVKNIDKIILVTGSPECNPDLINESKKLGIEYFSGNEENILDRMFQASKKFDSNIIVRITCDNPLIDFRLINEALDIFLHNNYDIVSNNRKKTYPLGFNFEVFSQSALKKLWELEFSKLNNTHNFKKTFIPPTLGMLKSSNFQNYDMLNKEDLSKIRLTIDYSEDYEVVKTICENLYSKNKFFSLEDVLDLIRKKPEILEINKKYVD